VTGAPGLASTRDLLHAPGFETDAVLVADEIGNVLEANLAARGLLGPLGGGFLLLELVDRGDRSDLYDLLGGRTDLCDASIGTGHFRFRREGGTNGAVLVRVTALASPI
jgi:hypothetical protein